MEEAESLSTKFFSSELDKVVTKIDRSKSPVLGGFNFIFYKIF